jgi:hypothetical protein
VAAHREEAAAAAADGVRWRPGSGCGGRQRPVPAWWRRLRRPEMAAAAGDGGCGGAEARVSESEKKNQALITMLEERNSCRIGCLH